MIMNFAVSTGQKKEQTGNAEFNSVQFYFYKALKTLKSQKQQWQGTLLERNLEQNHPHMDSEIIK